MENPYHNPLEFDGQQPLHGGVHGIVFQPQVPVMRRPAARPIGAFDQPILRENRTGIPTPVIAANDFEVKSSLITMVQNQRYNGLPLEDPLDHLDIFERLCRTVKMNGVPGDAIKMILFPFSLGNKAAQWEKSVPSELVSTWGNVKREFINKFYPKQKTAKIRNDIIGFKQGPHENLYEAWERLKDYTRKCPHHGVSQENLLGIFYRGALEHYRRSLDTASYGCFTNLTVEQGEQLIENFAQSEECYGGDYDRSMRDQDLENQMYKELNDKIDKLSRVFLVNQKAVSYVGEVDVDQQGYEEGSYDGIQRVQEDVHYLDNQNNYQGGYLNRPLNRNYINNNISYRSNNVENPQDQYYPPKAPQGNQLQPRPFGDSFQAQNPPWRSQGPQISAPANGYQGDMRFRPQGQPRQNAYPPARSSEQDDMKSMMKQLMEGQARVQAELTEKLDQFEQKIDSNHAESQAKFADIYSHLKTLDNQIAQVASTSKRPMGTFPGKPDTNPKEYVNSIDVMMVDTDENSEGDEDDAKEVVTDIVDAELPTATNETATIPPEYQPKLPFPGRFKKQMLARHEALLEQLLSKITFTLPLIESFLRHPNFPESVKEVLREKKNELRKAEMATQESDTKDQTKIITEQEEDPGQVLSMEELDALKEYGMLEADGKGGQKLRNLDKEYNEPGDLFEEKQRIHYTEAAPIDRSSATDRSVPSLKNRSENAGSIEPAQIDRSRNKELCNPTQDRSIIFRSIDHPPDDTTLGASSKRAGKRPTASPTTSLNKKKVKMKSQSRAPPLQEEERGTQNLSKGEKTLASPQCLPPI